MPPRNPWRALALCLGLAALAAVALLVAWEALPRYFPVRAHDVLGALPLTLIALAYLTYEGARRAGRGERVKAVLLATAFLLWAANQLWPERAMATLLNDAAIALFVLDVFFVIAGWPPGSAPAR